VEKRIKFVQLEVRSSIIQKALITACGESYWLSTSVSPLVIERPYVVLFHSREKIREYAARSERTAEEKAHMKLLTDFMTREHGRVEAEYNHLAAGRQITYNLLWTFFRPDEEVLIHNDQYTECGVLWKVRYYDEDGWEIGIRGWDYNGSHFGPVDKDVTVKPFEGLCDITTLEVCPSRFHKTQPEDSLRKKLIKRGHKWKQLLHVAHRSYSGTGQRCTYLVNVILTFDRIGVENCPNTRPTGLRHADSACPDACKDSYAPNFVTVV
jgi:hypothetical protein